MVIEHKVCRGGGCSGCDDRGEFEPRCECGCGRLADLRVDDTWLCRACDAECNGSSWDEEPTAVDRPTSAEIAAQWEASRAA